MIRELVLGTLLLGGGGYYVMASAGASADIVRTVDATPHETWQSFDDVLNEDAEGIADMGNPEDGGRGIGTPKVTSIDGKEIDFHIAKDGTDAIHLRLRFEPVDGGRKTKLLMDADIDPRSIPAGSPMGIGGGTLFKLALGKVVDAMIERIEAGDPIGTGFATARMRRDMAADPRYAEYQQAMRRYEQREAQEAASRPQLDPEEARMHPRGKSVRPSSPNPGY